MVIELITKDKKLKVRVYETRAGYTMVGFSKAKTGAYYDHYATALATAEEEANKLLATGKYERIK